MIRVIIANGTYFNRSLNGTFQLVAKERDDGSCKRDHYVRVINPEGGKEFGVHVFEKDVKYIDENDMEIQVDFGRVKDKPAIASLETPTVQTRTDEEMGDIIAERFQIMEMLTGSVIQQSTRALIVSGAPGISKTYTLEKMLTEALENEEISKFTHIKGRVTPLQLFVKLFEHKEEGEVLLLDDVDVFSESDSLDLLKAALDTSARRQISWASTLKWLEDQGIPQTFYFNGAVVFITNKNFDRDIARNTSLSVHYQALISRSHYLDLKVHSNREILIRVKQIIRDSSMIEDQGLTDQQGKDLVEWLETNMNDLREISIRSILKLAQYMKASPNNWRVMAKVLMNKES